MLKSPQMFLEARGSFGCENLNKVVRLVADSSVLGLAEPFAARKNLFCEGARGNS